jgi:iron complex transport system ATP-binding protein
MITVNNLSLTLAGASILKDISFSAAAGEYLSLIGPNGAGKTTLLRCLLGLHGDYAGEITLKGREARSYTRRERALTVSYVPQTHDTGFPLTVRYPHLKPLSPVTSLDIEEVENALEITTASALRNRTLQTLSGGERQKVYIAAALAQGSPLILLDEPAAFLDYHHQADIMRLLREININHRTTILTVNHDLNSAARWSDRLVAIKEGMVAFDGSPAELLEPEKLEALFDIPFRLIPDGELPLVIVDEAAAPRKAGGGEHNGGIASAS